MSLIQFLRILIARKFMILAAFVSCVAVATAVAQVLPPRYPATARVLLDIIKPDPVTGQAIASNSMRAYTRTQIELIRDYRVAGEVVDKIGWASDERILNDYYERGGTVGGDVRRFAAQRIIDDTEVNLIEGSNILQITYNAANPAVALRIVELLREAYLASSLRLRTDGAGRSADWFRGQAEKAQALLGAAEQTKTEFMRANGIILQGDVELETQRLNALQASLETSRASAGAQQTQAAQQLASDPTVELIKGQLAGVEDQLAQASAQLGTRHPTYQALAVRRDSLRRQLSRERASSRADVGSVTGVSRANVAQLDADFRQQRQRVVDMRGKLDQLAALQREVDIRREAFQKASARASDLRLEADTSETGLVLLGDAQSAQSPSWPNKPLIAALSAAFGLALGIAAALVVEMVARRIRGAEDLGFAAGAPVLAVIQQQRRSAFRQWVANRLSARDRRGLPAPTMMQPAE